MLGWVARGKSNALIGDILGISGATVDAHLRRIYLKLGVFDRISAAVRGHRDRADPFGGLTWQGIRIEAVGFRLNRATAKVYGDALCMARVWKAYGNAYV